MKANYDQYSGLTANFCHEIDGELWFSAANRNGIYTLNRDTQEVTFRCYFENEKIYAWDLYNDFGRVGNWLVFAPRRAETIAIYDRGSGAVSYLPLREIRSQTWKENCDASLKFWGAVTVGEAVYLLGYQYPAVVKLAGQDDRAVYLDDWVEKLGDACPAKDKWRLITDGYVRRGLALYVPLGCIPGILVIDIEHDTTAIQRIDCSLEGIGGMTELPDGRIAMVGIGAHADRLVLWDETEDSVEEIPLPDITDEMLDPFYAPFAAGGDLYLMPVWAKQMYRFCLATGQLETLLSFDSAPLAPHRDGEVLRYLTAGDRQWHEYNVRTGEQAAFLARYEENCEEYFAELLEYCLEEYGAVGEETVPLSFFLKHFPASVPQKEDENENDNQRRSTIFAQGGDQG